MLMKLEYIWLDGYDTPNLRCKCRFEEWEQKDESHVYTQEELVNKVPQWSFDGSSTKQADTESSDCVLSPVSVYTNPFDAGNSLLVLCEVMNPDGTPHETNMRSVLKKSIEEYGNDMVFGIEQEYFIMDKLKRKPIGWIYEGEDPEPQGQYYCSVGGEYNVGRVMTDQHAALSHRAGLNLQGTNSEVALGQWEYQIGPLHGVDCADQLWVSRYILQKLSEGMGSYINYDPKPVEGNWNGSGAHINFSTEYLRDAGGKEYIEEICNSLKETHKEDILSYGRGNEKRLTGKHETCNIEDFKYGECDRAASIRIPYVTIQENKGYLEDRRPAANVDPYRAFCCLVESVPRLPENIVETDYVSV